MQHLVRPPIGMGRITRRRCVYVAGAGLSEGVRALGARSYYRRHHSHLSTDYCTGRSIDTLSRRTLVSQSYDVVSSLIFRWTSRSDENAGPEN